MRKLIIIFLFFPVFAFSQAGKSMPGFAAPRWSLNELYLFHGASNGIKALDSVQIRNLITSFGYGVGTVTNVSGLNVNGFTWSIANPTTAPALTLSLQNATTSQSGQLTSTDWNTFNGKQSALTLTTTGSSGAATLSGGALNIPNYTLSGLGGISGTGTTGYLQYTNSTGTIANSNVFYNPSTGGLGFNTTTPIASGAGYSYTTFNSSSTTGAYLAMQYNGTTKGLMGAESASFNLIAGSGNRLVLGSNNLEKATISTTGNFGLADSSPNYDFSLGPAADRTIAIDNSATDVVGRNLLITSGRTSTGTAVNDVSGGDLTINAGSGTGAALESVIIQTPTPLASGKVLQSQTTRMTINSNGVSIPVPVFGTSSVIGQVWTATGTGGQGTWGGGNYHSNATGNTSGTAIGLTTVGASDGTYNVSVQLRPTAITGTIQTQVVYTDAVTNTSTTRIFTPMSATASTISTTGEVNYPVMGAIRAKAGTTITVTTTITGTVTYNDDVNINQLN